MRSFPALDELKSRLDSHRPLDPQRLQAVREKFHLEWTYHSNALEGNPLTLSETSFFIREGMTSKGRPLSAYLEARNHVEALAFLEDVVRQRTPMTEILIKQYHAMLFDKIDHVELGVGAERQRLRINAGQYKTQNNHVVRLDGKILTFTDWLQVPGDMERLIAWYNENRPATHPLELAALFHHRLVAVHPFLDGNGRLARLLLNTILMQAGYTPAIIPVEEKKRYLEVLQAADDGDTGLLIEFVDELVSRTLRMTLDVVEGREAFDFEDLSRLFRGIAARAKSIENDLGAGARFPEERSAETAQRVFAVIRDLLSKHATSAGLPDAPARVELVDSAVPGAGYDKIRHRFQNPSWEATASILVGGAKRTIPSLRVDVLVVSGRYEVAILSMVRLGKFDPFNKEVLDNDAGGNRLVGSISFEDWDTGAINEFLVGTLKDAYRIWDAEIERRRLLIAQEEENLKGLSKSDTGGGA